VDVVNADDPIDMYGTGPADGDRSYQWCTDPERIGATGQCEVTEEWTRLPGTDVEIRLRPPMRSGFVGYRQRWSS
jgi:hypothetical protein